MPRRPNLILITTDQQRGDCLGCAGHPVLETPYLDNLAREGTLFTNAFTSVPACTPARSAILTGMDQWNHGRLAMTGKDALEYPATLPGELARAGYHTRGVGKMHFSPQRRLYGFHHLVLDESARREGKFVSDYDAWFAEHRDGPYSNRPSGASWNSWVARPTHLPEHLHPTYWTAQEGIRFLETRDPDKPFFLWLSFARPHSPYDPPDAYFRMYLDNPGVPKPAIGDWAAEFDRRVDDIDAQYARRSEVETMRARAGYLGSITFIDHQVGRFLEHAPMGETMVIFTSDHGDMQGDHHHWRKGCPYQGAVRVPMIVRCPDTMFPAGTDPEYAKNSLMFPFRVGAAAHPARGGRCDRPVELRDIMPTFLDAADLPVPESVDGISLLKSARGEEVPEHRWVHGEHSVGFQYLSDGKRKYIWFHFTGREQLFDLEHDPLECRDLAGRPEHRDEIRLWRRVLAGILEQRGDPRGKNGKLIVARDGMAGDLPNFHGAITLSPNYERWRRRAAGLRGDG